MRTVTIPALPLNICIVSHSGSDDVLDAIKDRPLQGALARLLHLLASNLQVSTGHELGLHCALQCLIAVICIG